MRPTQTDYLAAVKAALAAGKRGDHKERERMAFAARIIGRHVAEGEPEPCACCGNLYDHRYPCVG